MYIGWVGVDLVVLKPILHITEQQYNDKITL